ncbi:MAG: hypothetical protein IK121_10575, partial [Lachnospiraceae bacterium]|nr:hypothetical protein [Lachnospiraceae bacterium]
MIKIQFNIRVLIDKRDNRVIVRVRWNQKANEVGFTTGMYAQEEKWDFLNQKAIKGTVHVINGNKFTACDINDRISEFQEEIRKVFSVYEMNNSVPTPSDLELMVNRELGRIEENTQTEKPKKTEASAEEPTATPKATKKPKKTEAPTQEPTATPKATKKPKKTEAPTEEPTATPKATKKPKKTEA